MTNPQPQCDHALDDDERAIGMLKDDPVVLRAAADYLESRTATLEAKHA